MIAVLGDTHIPGRAQSIPEEFLRELRRLGPEQILFTGDAVMEDPIRELESIAPVLNVRGNVDRIDAPEKRVIQLEGVRALLIHGNQVPRGDVEALSSLARQEECRILICGHTHKPMVRPGKIIILNPGSATGAWSGGGATPLPSMLLLETNGVLMRAELLTLTPELEKRTFTLDLTPRAQLY